MQKVKEKSNGKLKTIKRKEKTEGWIVETSSTGPSTKMIKLSKWIESDGLATVHTSSIALNQLLNQRKLIEEFNKSFAKICNFKMKNVNLINDPFLVTIVANFLADKSIIPNIVTEMESMEWTRKQMDLYEFYQTSDLANIQSPYLAQFYDFLNKDVKNWMQQLTGMKFKKISASCSMYNCGDFLLTHDDLLSDRLIAFVFYLSPWEDKENWSEAMGGALELFTRDHDSQPKFPAKTKILPANNQFVFFKVEKKSYHQVGEVLTKDFPRLTINGWFHGYEDNVDFDADAVKVKTPNILTFKPPANTKPELDRLVNKVYLKDGIKVSIQKQIEENSEAALGEFLINECHLAISKELQSKSLKWITKGPSNQQNFEVLDTEELSTKSNIKKLIDLMTSKVIFKLLHEYTELDLHGSNAKKPTCAVEIQRWKGGCYTLIGDPSTYNNDTLDLILYFGCNDNVGTITYLTPEEDHKEVQSEDSSSEVEPVLLTVYPQNNFLNIVYRSQGTAKFTKYCSKSSFMQSEFNYILFCSYKE